eukprot:TRINITY_DN9745_c0_g2_i1.p1 TRINITY_DN9745_c0_g2~~TRINITY_DN9745_c0_g2_i1.p1  ORF type:complete len:316 (-),score=90.06 TRINITY_DN9745_c0_g2_i1:128-1075(-)
MSESTIANAQVIIHAYDKAQWVPKSQAALRVDLYFNPTNNTARFIAYSGQQILMNAPISKDSQYQKNPGWHSFQDMTRNTWGFRFANPTDGDRFGNTVTDTLNRMKGGAGAPPPPKAPPVAPPASNPPKAPNPPPVAAAASAPSGGDDDDEGDGRNALLASIRAGRSLKKVAPPPENTSGLAGRVVGEGDKGGAPASSQTPAPRPAAAKPMDMGSELAMKLKQRSTGTPTPSSNPPQEKPAAAPEPRKPATLSSAPSSNRLSMSMSSANSPTSSAGTGDVAAMRAELDSFKKEMQQFIKSELDAMKKEILAALNK